MVKLSKRLQAIADMVTVQESVADIGCDHGFVAIYLVLKKSVKKVFALDINEGPLLRAKEHIEMNELSDVIETRLSDGAKALKAGESEGAIIAGMGGKLIVKILSDSSDRFESMKEVILSPHSEIDCVRAYLCSEGYEIIDEDMVYDEEKFYQIIRCRYTGSAYVLSKEELLFGPKNIAQKNPVLRQYIKEKIEKKLAIKDNINKQADISVVEKKSVLTQRVKELDDEIIMLQKLMDNY